MAYKPFDLIEAGTLGYQFDYQRQVSVCREERRRGCGVELQKEFSDGSTIDCLVTTRPDRLVDILYTCHIPTELRQIAAKEVGGPFPAGRFARFAQTEAPSRVRDEE